MSNSIFRPKALAKLSSPEQLDQLMQVVNPQGWLALLGLGSLLVFALVWSITGELDTRLEGQGILMRQGGLLPVVAPQAAQVVELPVPVGQVVQAGEPLVRLKAIAQGTGEYVPYDLPSPKTGRVVAWLTAPGDFVERGTPLLTLEAVDLPLEALVFVPIAAGKSVHPGMEVLLSPATAPKEQYGYLVGTVLTVSDFPLSTAELTRRLGNDLLAQMYAQQGALIEVRVTLATTPTGYQWSTQRGPAEDLTSGTPSEAAILVHRQRPITLLFPFLNP